MTPRTDVPTTGHRTRIEQELAARLAAAARPAGAGAPVGLRCLGCRAISPGDALFCTACGQRFNAVIVTSPGGSHRRPADQEELAEASTPGGLRTRPVQETSR